LKYAPQHSLEFLFKDAYKALCIVAYEYVVDADLAEDIEQGVFARMLERTDLDTIKYLHAYVKRAVVNDCLKSIEANKKKISLEQSHLDQSQSQTSEETETITREDRVFILNKLSLLPPGCRKIFLSCVVDGMKYKEAAELHNVTINTVKSQVKKGYKLLIYCRRILFLSPVL